MNKFPLIKLIETQNKFAYIYDARLNIILRVSKKEVKYLKDFLQNRVPIREEEIKFINYLKLKGFLKEGGLEKKIDNPEGSAVKIVEFAKSNAIPRKLTIEVTNDCNLRCKYCYYTINEKKGVGKKHGTQTINYSDAVEAIDSYFKSYITLFNKISYKLKPNFLKNHPPTFGFYGGEVLLQFKLIESLVKKIFELPWDENEIKKNLVAISITTNGTLLTSKIIRYCILHNIYLFISLDGPENQNDLNRVFKNRKGTTKNILNKIKQIKELSEEYYEKRVTIQAVMAPNLNIIKVLNFFQNDCKNNLFLNVSNINYLDFQEDKRENNLKLKKIQSENYDILELIEKHYKSANFIEKISRNFYIKQWLTSLAELYSNLNKPPVYNNIFNSNNSCYIGYMGLFVSSNSDLHMCERTDFSIPIGDINNGLNDEKIVNIYAKYLELLNSDKCCNCWIHYFCPFCIGALIENKNITLPSDEVCNSARDVFERRLFDLILIFNKYPKLFQYIENSLSNKDSISLTEFYQNNIIS